MSRWQPQVTRACLESWIALIHGGSSGSNHRVSLKWLLSRRPETRETSEFVSRTNAKRPVQRACLSTVPHFSSSRRFSARLSYFTSFPIWPLSRLSSRLAGFSSRSTSQRQVQRPHGRALNLCLLITPPWVFLIFIFLVPRSFARINFQSSAFKGFSKVSAFERSRVWEWSRKKKSYFRRVAEYRSKRCDVIPIVKQFDTFGIDNRTASCVSIAIEKSHSIYEINCTL